ncbi:MAG: hypothetical protein D6B25_08940 [Desulfobulbaceae bacterium]|nr:MAG: hypothetical protein D6B25_08940 [Desulfobulbaceae bacterium]
MAAKAEKPAKHLEPFVRRFRVVTNRSPTLIIDHMKVFEGHNQAGELIYFEIPNTFLPRRSAVKIIKRIPGVKGISEKLGDDVFFEFNLNDKTFEIMEPFGDNSRYHIGEETACYSAELILLKETFSRHKNIIQRLLKR